MRRLSPAIFVLSLTGIFYLIKIGSSWAGIDLPWSTTFDCPEWTDITPKSRLNCDGILEGGNWACRDGATLFPEQITTDANFSGGDGGKGQRHWVGDGKKNNSGGLSIIFNKRQTEWWIRFYMRYPLGFIWREDSNQSQKILYSFDSTLPKNRGAGYIGWLRKNRIRLQVDGDKTYFSSPGSGWHSVMGGITGDGRWHIYEMHFKHGNPGEFQLWIDGGSRLHATDVDFSQCTGWTQFILPSNTNATNNGRCLGQDFDDIAISNTGRIGPIIKGPQSP
ncbi:MAG: hypothetical protein CVU57_12840 [Deltaproteobacteria bacterium HGW-Deltaproteobacteria-15]|jgi:hypothetical protein|nr:MAG: hypothetical protein CVU57_12840 [Deltaproteobacteria bacterium HGW-Deltaproteobacteria-15]